MRILRNERPFRRCGAERGSGRNARSPISLTDRASAAVSAAVCQSRPSRSRCCLQTVAARVPGLRRRRAVACDRYGRTTRKFPSARQGCRRFRRCSPTCDPASGIGAGLAEIVLVANAQAIPLQVRRGRLKLMRTTALRKDRTVSFRRLFAVAAVLAGFGMSTEPARASDMFWRPCGPGYVNWLFLQGCAGADFRPACQEHDYCYQNCPSRKECDDNFHRGMCEACENSRHPHICRFTAWWMYKGTRVFGALYREESW